MAPTGDGVDGDGLGGKADEATPIVCEPVDLQAISDSIGPVPAGTEERTRWLTRYASVLLASQDCEVDRALQPRGVDGDSLAFPEGYEIQVRGQLDSCFSDDERFLRPDFELRTPENFHGVKRQVEYLVSFMRDFHLSMDGRKTPSR